MCAKENEVDNCTNIGGWTRCWQNLCRWVVMAAGNYCSSRCVVTDALQHMVPAAHSGLSGLIHVTCCNCISARVTNGYA
jgi:hypothetical protein